MTSNELRLKRAEAHAAAKDIRATKIGPDGNFTDPLAEVSWRKSNEDYERLTKLIAEVEAQEARERSEAEAEYRAKNDRKPEAAQAETRTPEQNYEGAFFRYLMRGRDKVSADDLRFLETRGTNTQITTTDSLGGYLVPTSFSNELETAMKYYGPILQACRIYDDTIGGTLEWPTGDDTASVGAIQTTEGGQVSVADLTYGIVNFGHYTFTSNIVKVSRQLLQDERVGLLRGILVNQLAERIGRNINAKLTTGTGTAQPYGIVTTAASGKEAASQTAFTQSELIDLLHSVDKAYRDNPSAGWMMHDTIFAAARKLDVTNTNTVQFLTSSMIAGEPDRLLGKPIYINNDMASTQAQSAKIVLFGDFSKYIIRRISPISVERNDTLYWDSLNVGFMGWTRLDANLVAAGAVKYLQNKTT